MKNTYIYIMVASVVMMIGACNSKTTTQVTKSEQPVALEFSADSAYWFCEQQCLFGPRTMNSTAHDQPISSGATACRSLCSKPPSKDMTAHR